MRDTYMVIEKWFDAFGKGKKEELFELMDENIHWENCNRIKGVNDMIPWLGTYDGKENVIETFGMVAKVSRMEVFELHEIRVDGEMALTHVFEQNILLETGAKYRADVMFEMRVVNEKVVSLKTYWDTAEAVKAFATLPRVPEPSNKMIFYVQMKWNYQGRLSQDALWTLESQEGAHSKTQPGIKVLDIYKVASQHRVIVIVEADSIDALDISSMGGLPMREYLEFEHVWALRDYNSFIEDANRRFS